MYNFLTKHGQAAALGLGLLVIAIFLISVMTGLSGSGFDMGTDLNGLPDETKAGIGFFDSGLLLTIAMAVIAFVLAFIVFGIMGIIKFPKSSIKGLAGVVALAVVFAIFYFTAGTEYTGKLAELVQKNDLTDNVVKFISGGMNVTIILAGMAVLIAVVFEVKNAFS